MHCCYFLTRNIARQNQKWKINLTLSSWTYNKNGWIHWRVKLRMKKRTRRHINTISINNLQRTSKTMLNILKNRFLSNPLVKFIINLRNINLRDSKPWINLSYTRLKVIELLISEKQTQWWLRKKTWRFVKLNQLRNIPN